MKEEKIKMFEVQDVTLGEVQHYTTSGGLLLLDGTTTHYSLFIENEDGKTEPLVMKQEQHEWVPVWTRKIN